MLQRLISFLNRSVAFIKSLIPCICNNNKNIVEQLCSDSLKEIIDPFNNRLIKARDEGQSSRNGILSKAIKQSQIDFERHGPYGDINGENFKDLSHEYIKYEKAINNNIKQNTSHPISESSMKDFYHKYISNRAIAEFIAYTFNQTYFEGMLYQILFKNFDSQDYNDYTILKIASMRTADSEEKLCAFKITEQNTTCCIITLLNRIDIFEEKNITDLPTITLDFKIQFNISDIGEGKISVGYITHDIAAHESVDAKNSKKFLEYTKKLLQPFNPRYVANKETCESLLDSFFGAQEKLEHGSPNKKKPRQEENPEDKSMTIMQINEITGYRPLYGSLQK